MGDCWEGEIGVPTVSEKVAIAVPAPKTGPTEGQATFCRHLLADLDALFARCRPVFEGEFEQWTGRPFPSNWRDEFSLGGIALPEDGDEARPWDVGYSLLGAEQLFTAFLEGGQARYAAVDD
jgi:hypothetical protein